MTANRTHHTPASVQSAGARSMLNLHDGHVPSLHLSLFVLHHVDGCLAAYHRYIQYYGLASSNNGNILMLQVGPTENCPTYHNLRHIISLVLSRTAHSYNFKIIAYHLFQMLWSKFSIQCHNFTLKRLYTAGKMVHSRHKVSYVWFS